MNKHLERFILEATQANSYVEIEEIQQLWSGYGKISRIQLDGGMYNTLILKHIVFPNKNNHPRGWNTSFSHQRKVKSYEIEIYWYTHYIQKCTSGSRVPQCIGATSAGEGHLILMEDLDASGYSLRKQDLNVDEVKKCLSWLASFHATFMNHTPDGLWKIGTYWHLDTRPDEFKVMQNALLKEKAHWIDEQLNACTYQTLVHGDAKVANFCFSVDGNVAAVDFQYVGGGCGMKDVIYFLGSCMDEEQCELGETEFLKHYFSVLKKELQQQNKEVNFEALEEEWRRMYAIAWTDFYRFLNGWMPNHHKINAYTLQLANRVLNESLN